MNTELVKIVTNPEIKRRLAELGVEAAGTSAADLERYARGESAKWARIAKDHNIRIES